MKEDTLSSGANGSRQVCVGHCWIAWGRKDVPFTGKDTVMGR